MNTFLPIYLYGSIIITAGIFLLVFGDTSFNNTKIALGIALIVGGIFALVTALSRQRNQVQFVYHEMHALAMLVYGISILFFSSSMVQLISFTAFLFIFYAFSEIIFCNWLFNLSQKINLRIVIVRAFLGLAIGIGTVVALNFTDSTLQIFGILFVLVGINILFYVPVLKKI